MVDVPANRNSQVVEEAPLGVRQEIHRLTGRTYGQHLYQLIVRDGLNASKHRFHHP